jgi:Fe-S cluster biogenesis protein NfuA/nitrite reductase/ring-hydroxylating ferredoxin subunit
MDLDAALAQLEQLVATLEREGDERALLALQLVDAVHRPALERIAAGEIDHPLVEHLLAMYGFGLEPELLAEEALDTVRPYIESHGGEVELLAVDEGVVHVRLQGACVGCAGSAMTLRRGIEEALREHMPGFREVVAEEAAAEPAITGVALPMADARRPVFVDVGDEASLAEGVLLAVDADGTPVLLARHGGEVYALRNGCAVDGLPLEGSRLSAEGVLVCPWHNCAYDVRSGLRVDDGSGRLGVVPVAVRDGTLKVAVNVA